MPATPQPGPSTDALATHVLERFAGAPLNLGSRTSPMAKAQAEHVKALITARVPGLEVQIVGIETSADQWLGDLAQLGGKGNFTKEIDRALIAGQIDIAVHCMKDVPGDVPLPPGTQFGAYLERDDVHDVVVTRDGCKLADLKRTDLIDTSSVRRRAQLGMYRPGQRTERIRGAVNTRIEKKLDNPDARLAEGKEPFAALILARAGLERLGMLDRPHEVLPIESVAAAPGGVAMMPAVGAGVIGIQARTADAPVMQLLEEFNHPETARWILAERTMLHMLRGHCNSPIAGHCYTTADGKLGLFGMVFNRDGSDFVRSQDWGPVDDPATLGSVVASDLLKQGAMRLINATRK